jgi:hypothetical protein
MESLAELSHTLYKLFWFFFLLNHRGCILESPGWIVLIPLDKYLRQKVRYTLYSIGSYGIELHNVKNDLSLASEIRQRVQTFRFISN